VVIDGVHDQIATTIGALPVGATSISVAPQTNVALVTFEASNALRSSMRPITMHDYNDARWRSGIQLGCPFDFPPLSHSV